MADRKVAWTALTEADLMRVVEFVASDDPATAGRVLERVLERAASLVDMAERGRKVPELRITAATDQRELIVRPWRLFYVIDGGHVRVTAVLGGRWDVARLLRDRFAKGGLRR